jgi:GTPase SAR1 family protein
MDIIIPINNNAIMKDAARVKILILGESSVGKSSLLTQFVEQKFTGSHMPTIGV